MRLILNKRKTKNHDCKKTERAGEKVRKRKEG